MVEPTATSICINQSFNLRDLTYFAFAFTLTLSLTLSLSLFIFLILRSIILRNPINHKFIGTSSQTIQPKQIQSLQTSQQGKRDYIRNPAFVLLRIPIEFVWSDSLKLAAR